MEIKLTLESQQLTMEDLKHLVQSIRDCEQKSFPDKEIFIWIEAPELTSAECAEILTSIKPAFGWDIKIIGRGEFNNMKGREN